MPNTIAVVRTFGWQPCCTRPDDLVLPLRVGTPGGPTRSAVRGRGWRRTSPGFYVPSDVDPAPVEQRILEQSVRLGDDGGVTAWAALRWYGAAYFDGLADRGRRQLPVPLLVLGRNVRPGPGFAPSWEQFAPSERRIVAGLPCASVQRALFDEMRRTGSVRDAVVALDMAAAAKLISVALMTIYVTHRPAWTGVPMVRKALALATNDSKSPPESRMRLVWQVDAALPEPVCNQPLFSRSGQLLGSPDLLDPVSGTVVEYDGADHLVEDRRRHDLDREALFRDHGLEYLTVVAGMLSDRERLAGRMRAVRGRSRFAAPEDRRWTLEHPPWFEPPESLDHLLERAGLADELAHP
jgi:hypothetical protein